MSRSDRHVQHKSRAPYPLTSISGTPSTLNFMAQSEIDEWLTGFPTGCHFTKGQKRFALPRRLHFDSVKDTQTAHPGLHKASFYNMLGREGQTVRHLWTTQLGDLAKLRILTP